MTARRERGWQDRVVLVTGIGGFVGSSLARELLADRARLETMSKRMLAVARPQAADEIAEELIALAGR